MSKRKRANTVHREMKKRKNWKVSLKEGERVRDTGKKAQRTSTGKEKKEREKKEGRDERGRKADAGRREGRREGNNLFTSSLEHPGEGGCGGGGTKGRIRGDNKEEGR